jgi:5-methylcytosine-specific restriction endonuclease McrA
MEEKYSPEELAILPTQQRRRILHQRAKRRMDDVMHKCGYKCHWCGKALIRKRHIPRAEKILLQTKDKVIWLSKGVALTRWWASVDHIVPICEGGDSDIGNLVASCQPCNRKRAAKYVNPNPDQPKWKGVLVCKCGNEKEPKNRKCTSCANVSKQFRRLCTVTIISVIQDICRRCGREMKPLQFIEGFGQVYGCDSQGCLKKEWPSITS